VRIALLGAGTVGGSLARLVARRPALGVEIVGAYVRDTRRARDGLARLVGEPFALLDDESVVAVVEVLGGEEPARSLILAAFERGKHVVTANKLVLATHWGELQDAARGARRVLRYEAAVGGAMPVIAALRALSGTRPRSLRGILNGTTNFILTSMEEQGLSFEDALRAAQQAGFAEADPSSDVDGWDAAYKLAICVATVERRPFSPELVRRESLRGVSASRLAEARDRGRRLRYIAAADFGARAVKARVGLEEVEEGSLLARPRGPENALEIEADTAGTIRLMGPGAGGEATASAILGDLLTIGDRR
jgi:homoserine dehydrogenase